MTTWHNVKRVSMAYGAGYCVGWLVSDWLIDRAAEKYAQRRRSMADHPAGKGSGEVERCPFNTFTGECALPFGHDTLTVPHEDGDGCQWLNDDGIGYRWIAESDRRDQAERDRLAATVDRGD